MTRLFRTSLPVAALLPALLPALFAALPAAAADERLRAAVDAIVQPLQARHGVPGVAVGITVDGNATFFNYGLAARAPDVPVTEHTLFELGSISKTFTATLVAWAEATGKLSLDDHPSRHLPRLAGSPIDRATLLELGTYTAAGLPLQFPDELGDYASTMAWFKQWQPPAPPGAVRRYSNPSIGLFGNAAAQALREEFGPALERHILPGLGLTSTWVNVPPAAMPRYAWGEDANGKPARMTLGALDAEAYGVTSTAADMVRYLQAQLAPHTLPAPLRAAVEATQLGRFDMGDMVQGLGWEQYPYPVPLARLHAGNSARMSRGTNPAIRLLPPRRPGPDTLFNKTGATRGFGAYALFIPARRTGIVILANKAWPIEARIDAAYAILAALERQEPRTAQPAHP